MPEAAAKEGDNITGKSTVWVQPGSSPTTVPFTYNGSIDNSFSPNVFIMGKHAAIVGSKATTNPVPPVPNLLSPIDNPVDNKIATITTGSSTVFINNKSAARNKDKAEACDFSTTPSPGKCDKKQNGNVDATGSVYIGG
ncbi:MAG: PAAR domain-containing protein [Ignavibacteriales bacterium]